MALVLLVLGLLGIAVVVVSWWSLPEVLGEDRRGELRPAEATVVESASCGTSTKGDLVEVRVGGELRQARFDGCGHLRGQKLAVQVPVDPDADFVVRPPEEPGWSVRDRVTAVLATLSAVAGGSFAFLLRSARVRKSRAVL